MLVIEVEASLIPATQLTRMGRKCGNLAVKTTDRHWKRLDERWRGRLRSLQESPLEFFGGFKLKLLGLYAPLAWIADHKRVHWLGSLGLLLIFLVQLFTLYVTWNVMTEMAWPSPVPAASREGFVQRTEAVDLLSEVDADQRSVDGLETPTLAARKSKQLLLMEATATMTVLTLFCFWDWFCRRFSVPDHLADALSPNRMSDRSGLLAGRSPGTRAFAAGENT